MSKPNLANVEVLESCPQCGGSVILIGSEWACSNCGFRLLTWFDPERPLVERAREFHMKLRKRIEQCEGGKGSEPVATTFLVDSPTSSIATHGEGSSVPPKPSEHEGKVPEAGKKDNSPAKFHSAALPVPAPPSFILTEDDLRRLMKEDCFLDEAPGEQRFTHGRPTSAPLPFSTRFAGCPPETQQKLCKFYDVGTHICKEDGTVWCLNPAAPICWTRIDQERAKKSWPVYKGSQWKNNAECPVCGAKVNYEIASCETGCNYCCDEHATQHVKEETPEGGW